MWQQSPDPAPVTPLQGTVAAAFCCGIGVKAAPKPRLSARTGCCRVAAPPVAGPSLHRPLLPLFQAAVPPVLDSIVGAPRGQQLCDAGPGVAMLLQHSVVAPKAVNFRRMLTGKQICPMRWGLFGQPIEASSFPDCGGLSGQT